MYIRKLKETDSDELKPRDNNLVLKALTPQAQNICRQADINQNTLCRFDLLSNVQTRGLHNIY